MVAHSLGCKMLVRALREMEVEERPCEVHLAAPALVEAQEADILPSIARQAIIVLSVVSVLQLHPDELKCWWCGAGSRCACTTARET